jgi:hypothetical protein
MLKSGAIYVIKSVQVLPLRGEEYVLYDLGIDDYYRYWKNYYREIPKTSLDIPGVKIDTINSTVDMGDISIDTSQTLGPAEDGYIFTYDDGTGLVSLEPAPVGDKHYEHVQAVPASVWNITHSLAKFPAVTIVDTGGNEVEGAVNHVDNNSLTLTFTASFAGKAYMN